MFTQEQEDYLVENIPGRSNQELTDLLNQKYSLKLDGNQVKSYKKNHHLGRSGLTGQYTKGSSPYNKGKKYPGKINSGCFTKGQTPVNHKPVGSERIDSKDGYILIKTAEPGTWELKHKVLWEETYGAVPEGHKLVFTDGNRSNIALENLILVTDSQLLIMNRNDLIYKNPDLTKTGVNIAKLYEKISERKNK